MPLSILPYIKPKDETDSYILATGFSVDGSLCTGRTCGKCITDGKTWFRWNNEGKAEIYHQPSSVEQNQVLAIMNNCPAKAIKQTENTNYDK